MSHLTCVSHIGDAAWPDPESCFCWRVSSSRADGPPAARARAEGAGAPSGAGVHLRPHLRSSPPSRALQTHGRASPPGAPDAPSRADLRVPPVRRFGACVSGCPASAGLPCRAFPGEGASVQQMRIDPAALGQAPCGAPGMRLSAGPILLEELPAASPSSEPLRLVIWEIPLHDLPKRFASPSGSRLLQMFSKDSACLLSGVFIRSDEALVAVEGGCSA